MVNKEDGAAGEVGLRYTAMHHFQLNCSYTASLCEALMLSTSTHVSQFVSQYDAPTEFLLSIGKVKHGKCLYTYPYKITYMYHLPMITHHETYPMHGP